MDAQTYTMDAQTYINKITAIKLDKLANLLSYKDCEDIVKQDLINWRQSHEVYGIRIDYETIAKENLTKWVDAQYYGAAKDVINLLTIIREINETDRR